MVSAICNLLSLNCCYTFEVETPQILHKFTYRHLAISIETFKASWRQQTKKCANHNWRGYCFIKFTLRFSILQDRRYEYLQLIPLPTHTSLLLYKPPPQLPPIHHPHCQFHHSPPT